MHRLILAVLSLTSVACATGGAGPDGPDPVADVAYADSAVADLLTRRIAATNAQDWDTWQQLHADNCVRTAPDLSQPITSSAEMRAAVVRLGNAFPDYHVVLIRLLGQGPWFAAELQSSGTMKHALEVPGSLAIPPTGRHFRQQWMAFFRLENGRIAEFHERYDQTNLVDQLTGKDVPKSWE
jgi:predicted ester cyclase